MQSMYSLYTKESNHAVYSLYSSDILGGSIDCRDNRDVRFDSKRKMKTSPFMGPSKDRISVN